MADASAQTIPSTSSSTTPATLATIPPPTPSSDAPPIASTSTSPPPTAAPPLPTKTFVIMKRTVPPLPPRSPPSPSTISTSPSNATSSRRSKSAGDGAHDVGHDANTARRTGSEPGVLRKSQPLGISTLDEETERVEGQVEEEEVSMLDEVLRDALTKARERQFLYDVEAILESFLSDVSAARLPLAPPVFPPQLNSYQRLLVHRLADIFGIRREATSDSTGIPPPMLKAGYNNGGILHGTVVILVKTPEARRPPRKLSFFLSSLPPSEPSLLLSSSTSVHQPSLLRTTSAPLSSPTPATATATTTATHEPSPLLPTDAPPIPSPSPTFYKILPRTSKGSASPSSALSSTGAPDDEASSSGGRSASGRKEKTLEERELAYKAARERIFSLEENLTPPTMEKEKEGDRKGKQRTTMNPVLRPSAPTFDPSITDPNAMRMGWVNGNYLLPDMASMGFDDSVAAAQVAAAPYGLPPFPYATPAPQYSPYPPHSGPPPSSYLPQHQHQHSHSAPVTPPHEQRARYLQPSTYATTPIPAPSSSSSTPLPAQTPPLKSYLMRFADGTVAYPSSSIGSGIGSGPNGSRSASSISSPSTSRTASTTSLRETLGTPIRRTSHSASRSLSQAGSFKASTSGGASTGGSTSTSASGGSQRGGSENGESEWSVPADGSSEAGGRTWSEAGGSTSTTSTTNERPIQPHPSLPLKPTWVPPPAVKTAPPRSKQHPEPAPLPPTFETFPEPILPSQAAYPPHPAAYPSYGFENGGGPHFLPNAYAHDGTPMWNPYAPSYLGGSTYLPAQAHMDFNAQANYRQQPAFYPVTPEHSSPPDMRRPPPRSRQLFDPGSK